MNWLELAVNTLGKLPVERLFIKSADRTKALDELEANLKNSQKLAPPTTSTRKAEKPPEIEPQEASKVHLAEPQPGGLSMEQTVDYQNREVGKLLLRMERHYAQRLRINGIPCDCGSSKHLLDLESLCEETVPMVANAQVYYRIVEWIKKVGPTSTDAAAKSGLHDEEYPTFSHEARDFRKEILGTVDPSALFPQKPGEPEGTRILPVISEEEKVQIREQAQQKIDKVLGIEEVVKE